MNNTKQQNKNKQKGAKNNDFIENKKQKSIQKAEIRNPKVKQIKVKQMKNKIKT